MSIQTRNQRYVPHIRLSDEQRTHLVAQLVDPGSGVALHTVKKAYSENDYEATNANHALYPPLEREIATPPETPESVHITIQHSDTLYVIRYFENGRLLDEVKYAARDLGLEDTE